MNKMIILSIAFFFIATQAFAANEASIPPNAPSVQPFTSHQEDTDDSSTPRRAFWAGFLLAIGGMGAGYAAALLVGFHTPYRGGFLGGAVGLAVAAAINAEQITVLGGAAGIASASAAVFAVVFGVIGFAA